MLGGALAVQAFFMISGFYMALVLNEKYPAGRTGYREFIVSRVLRIFPAYFLAVSMTALVLYCGYLYYGELEGSLHLWFDNWNSFDWYARAYLLLTHLTLLGQDTYHFLGLDGSGGLMFDENFNAHRNQFANFMIVPQAWSLSLELYFYMLAPFLVRRPVRQLIWIIAGSIAIRLALKYGLGWEDDPWNYRFFPSELAVFLFGALGYRIYRRLRRGSLNLKEWGGWCAVGLLACVVLEVNQYQGASYPTMDVLLVVAILLGLPFLFGVSKNWKIDRLIGELSYPVYLTHMLVIWIFVLFEVSDGPGKSAGIVLCTLLVSALVYLYLDRPIDAYRSTLSRASGQSEQSNVMLDISAAPQLR